MVLEMTEIMNDSVDQHLPMSPSTSDVIIRGSIVNFQLPSNKRKKFIGKNDELLLNPSVSL